MNSEKHVESELIAYLDNEVSEEDKVRIRTHLVGCASCRAVLDELQFIRHDLGLTLDNALSPIRLSYDADERIRQVVQTKLVRRPAWWQTIWMRRGLVSQAIMAVFLLFLSVTTLRVIAPSEPVPIHETIVMGQDQFSPGSQGALRVVVQSLGSVLPSSVPIQGAKVVVSLARTTGVIQELFRGQTDSSGSAAVNFTMPVDVQGDADLIVETTSLAGTERVIRPIHVKRSYKIYLGSDKPTYRPGQTIHLRALVMDAVEGLPTTEKVLSFFVFDEKEQKLYEESVLLSDYGVGFADLALPGNAATGSYTIRAVVEDTVVERLVEINLYPLPEFHIIMETIESYAKPGGIIRGSITCAYFFKKPVQGTAKIIVFVGDGVARIETEGELDDEGVFNFSIMLPENIKDDSLTIVASVQDSAGRIEGLQRVLALSDTPIVIDAIPESGRLKPGLENIVYLSTVYPDGTPAETELQAVIDDIKYRIASDSFGLAKLSFTPQASTDLTVVASDADGRVAEKVINLVADTSPLLLRAERAAYKVGESLVLETLVGLPDADYAYLDVMRSSQTVAVLSAPIEDNKAVFAIDLDESLTGALNLRAYVLDRNQSIVEDTRIVVVDPDGRLDISVTADQASYRPGDTAQVHIATTVEDPGDGQMPARSLLGIAVVDTSVLSLEMLPPGFARTYFLMDDAMIDIPGTLPVYNPSILLDGNEPQRQAQDMAAKAAWAGTQNIRYSNPSSIRIESIDEAQVQRTQLARGLSWLLILTPVGMCILVVDSLTPSGVFWRACRRLGWGMLALAILTPLVVGGLFVSILLPWLGAGLSALVSLLVTVVLISLLILSWIHRDSRLQLTVVLVTLYVAVTVCVLVLTAMRVDEILEGTLVGIVAVFFLVMLASLFTFGQGLILEGHELKGWLLTLLVVLLILLAISLPGVPRLDSRLSQTMSNPFLYSGPVGWFTGCAMPQMQEPEATEEPSTEVERTVMPAATPSPMATASPQPPGTATPVLIPLEPYPLRQLFPETLYWAPNVETNPDGLIDLDIKMADTLTTWQLTALGSTKQGDIGAAHYDFRVFQDFFVDVDLEESIFINESVEITLTVFNYLDTSQTVRWEILESEKYLVDVAPEILKVDAGEVASTTLVLIPLRPGEIQLDIEAAGDNMVDAVRITLDVIDQ